MSLHYALPIFDGTALAMTAKGTMARALDTGQMAFTMTARADDLKLVDAVIEAGLFGTQPVNLAAHVERAGAKWIVTGLQGTNGGSRLTGPVTVQKKRKSAVWGKSVFVR